MYKESTEMVCTGHSTVGSEAASISGFSQPRSQSGSVSSLHSDFKGVAEHLQGRHGRQYYNRRQAPLCTF